MNSDDYRVQPSISMEELRKVHSSHGGLLKTSVLEQTEQSYLNHIARQRHEQEREQLRGKLKAFRESYIKIRTNNIVLDHQSAIELTKVIYTEADSLTYTDMV